MNERYRPFGGIFKIFQKGPKANREAISQMSVVDNFKTQLSATHRDKKIEALKELEYPTQYLPDTEAETKRRERQDKICETLAIMRMAATDTWLNIRQPKPTETIDTRKASKSRDEIIDQVCETVLGEAISEQDFDLLYGQNFTGSEKDRNERHWQKNLNPERRILLIKSSDQFIEYAQKHPENELAQQRLKKVLSALENLTSGKVFDGLDKAHIADARTEAASVLANHDVRAHKRSLKSYFEKREIPKAAKLQVAGDISVQTLGQAEAVSYLLTKTPVDRLNRRALATLLNKLKSGLHLSHTDEEILDTRRHSNARDTRPAEKYITDEGESITDETKQKIKVNVLAGHFSRGIALKALNVLGRLHPESSTLVLVEAVEPNRHDDYRGSSVPNMSVEMIKSIPDFLLKLQPIDMGETTFNSKFEAVLAGMRILKEQMSPAQIARSIMFLRQGYYGLLEDNVENADPSQTKMIAYLEMMVNLNSRLARSQRFALFNNLDIFVGAIPTAANTKAREKMIHLARKLVA